MLPTQKLLDILEKGKLLSKEEIAKLQTEAECKAISLEECIFKKRLITPEKLYKTAAAFFELPYVSLTGTTIPEKILKLVPEAIARTHRLIPYAKEGQLLKLALLDPDDSQTIEFIEKKTGFTIDLAITTPENLEEALKQYKKSLETEFAEIARASKKPDEELAKHAPVIRIVDTLLEHAALREASDIHIEPREKEVSVRFRVDGILREVMTVPKEVHAGLIARVKILANLKIDEHRLPQDGRFRFEVNSRKISIRVSIFPMFDGEKIVMRLLPEDLKILNINDLGFLPKQLAVVLRAIKKPHGLILVTGPTGSGKTTTLYALLAILNRPDVNISTIEDPIEYRLPHVNQSQANPRVGFTFAVGLRSLLRQDPNIIMVGEIRDSETADIAMNAALTGHIVLSTLHTNDAVTAIPRLIDLDAPPFLIAQTAALITAQRLVRKLCQHCISPYTLTKEMVKELETHFDLKAIVATLVREDALSEKEEPKLEGMRFFKSTGCAQCGSEGYRGRLALHEIFAVTSEINALIYERATTDKLRAAARAQGMLTLVEDGFIKAKQGLTTIAEILRVTKE